MIFHTKRVRYKRVVYSKAHWRRLSALRSEARQILACLGRHGIEGVVIGSIARGDVHEKSDVDVFVTGVFQYYIVEEALLSCGFYIEYARIVKATPHSGVRLVYSLGARRFINIPVTIEKREEEEFIKYAGYLTVSDIEKNVRKPGINKKLVLIIPTKRGHEEHNIWGIEAEAARLLGISLSTIEERINARRRRFSKGRSGLFIDLTVRPEEVAYFLDRLTR